MNWKEIKSCITEIQDNNESNSFDEHAAWLTMAEFKAAGLSSTDLNLLTKGIQFRVLGKGPQHLRITLADIQRKYHSKL